MQVKKQGMICRICGQPQTDKSQERCPLHGCQYVEGYYWETVEKPLEKAGEIKPENQTIIRL